MIKPCLCNNNLFTFATCNHLSRIRGFSFKLHLVIFGAPVLRLFLVFELREAGSHCGKLSVGASLLGPHARGEELSRIV